MSRDGTLRMWELDTGQQLGPAMTDHDGYTKALAPVGPHGYVTGGMFEMTKTFWSVDPRDVDRHGLRTRLTEPHESRMAHPDR